MIVLLVFALLSLVVLFGGMDSCGLSVVAAISLVLVLLVLALGDRAIKEKTTNCELEVEARRVIRANESLRREIEGKQK